MRHSLAIGFKRCMLCRLQAHVFLPSTKLEARAEERAALRHEKSLLTGELALRSRPWFNDWMELGRGVMIHDGRCLGFFRYLSLSSLVHILESSETLVMFFGLP